jgi:hypothetical protein
MTDLQDNAEWEAYAEDCYNAGYSTDGRKL